MNEDDQDYERVRDLVMQIGLVIKKVRPSAEILLVAMSDSLIKSCIAADLNQDQFKRLMQKMLYEYEGFKKDLHEYIDRNADEILERMKAERESKQ